MIYLSEKHKYVLDITTGLTVYCDTVEELGAMIVELLSNGFAEFSVMITDVDKKERLKVEEIANRLNKLGRAAN